jgi:hypothetical protein
VRPITKMAVIFLLLLWINMVFFTYSLFNKLRMIFLEVVLNI